MVNWSEKVLVPKTYREIALVNQAKLELSKEWVKDLLFELKKERIKYE